MPLQKPEVRHDLIHDRFVIIAPKRGVRPNDVERREAAAPKRESNKNCPFCNEPLTAENTLLAMCGRKHWCVRVVQNKFPAVTLDNPKAYGTQEVLIETPLLATPVLPPHIGQRLRKAEEWQIVHGKCYSCDLLVKERKGPRRISIAK